MKKKSLKTGARLRVARAFRGPLGVLDTDLAAEDGSERGREVRDGARGGGQSQLRVDFVCGAPPSSTAAYRKFFVLSLVSSLSFLKPSSPPRIFSPTPFARALSARARPRGEILRGGKLLAGNQFTVLNKQFLKK